MDGSSGAVSRRTVLGLGAVAALSGCARIAERIAPAELPASLEVPKGKVEPVVRLLDRAGFGPRPGEVAEAQELGPERWLDRQLTPTQGEPAGLQMQLNRLTVMAVDGMELRDLPENEMLIELQAAALLRSVYSPWQLRERMVDFWTNHFNIYGRKGLASYRLPSDTLNVVRANALRTFPALLTASAHSPAMLAYLDNRLNYAGVPNENYARELMELHTLGVHGGYTQKDVLEVARCFTGWGVEERFLHHHGAFRFDPDRHDNGEKIVLGQKIPAGGGQDDGERVLGILGSHPACARFVSQKLCRHFLGTADSPWVDKLSAIYLRTRGDIKSMLKPLLLSSDVLEGQPVIKRPVDFLVSALRVTNAQTDCLKPVQKHLEDMGQPLFQWPMPDGYPDKAVSWTGSILARWNFSLALSQGQIQGTQTNFDELSSRLSPNDPAGQMAELALPGREGVAERLRPALQKHLKNNVDLRKAMALCLAAPEFQWR